LSVSYYGPGDLSSGFVGFRVHVNFGGKPRQHWYSTKKVGEQSDSNPYFRMDNLRAQVKDAELLAESALYQYTVFTTQNHPTANPYRGVGVHALTMDIKEASKRYRGKERWEPMFNVWWSENGKRRHRAFTFYNYLYSEAWREAVLLWGNVHEILQKDIDRLLENPPSPERFKELRRHLNENHDSEVHELIPVSALSPVFRETRENLARESANTAHQVDAGVAVAHQDIAAWFERETGAQ
jgi:hypothetical protein